MDALMKKLKSCKSRNQQQVIMRLDSLKKQGSKIRLVKEESKLCLKEGKYRIAPLAKSYFEIEMFLRGYNKAKE